MNLFLVKQYEKNLKANGFASGDILNREKLEAFRGSLVDHYQSVGRYNTIRGNR